MSALWVVDFGALFHLTSKRKCFSSYITGGYGYVKMGNDRACKIVGIGNVCLSTSIGYRLMLKDVRLNLILAGRLDDDGYNGSFHNCACMFCKGSLIVAQAQK